MLKDFWPRFGSGNTGRLPYFLGGIFCSFFCFSFLVNFFFVAFQPDSNERMHVCLDLN